MRVFLAGGTGFIGGHVLAALLDAGHDVTALGRNPKRLTGLSDRAQVVQGDLPLPHTYRAKLAGHTASVNCVGLRRQAWWKRGVSYARVVVRGTEAWVAACRDAGVKHLVLVSAIGAGPEGAPYQRSKWLAEQAVRQSGLTWTIFRPSIVFGPGPGRDVTREFAALLKTRFLPVFVPDDVRFEPVAVWDLARAIAASLATPEAKNRTFSVGGPDQLSLFEIYDEVRRATGTKAAIPRLPTWTGHVATGLFGWLPFFPATHENFQMLLEGVVAADDEWARVFNIRPTLFREGIRTYLVPA